ncbi:MAG TPA: methyltransferase domain-containing protein [Nocardioides sp.]|nr:methyltransferase domain-containing protein [Nocardioides sp.]
MSADPSSVPSSGTRPSAHRNAVRTAAVWSALEPLLGGEKLTVIDLGGGTGGFAVPVAELGHDVTVIDPSPDALAALARRAAELGVEVTALQGDASTLAQMDPGSADLVLCHGVLEVVPNVAIALVGIRGVLKPGGSVSLLVGQRSSAVLGRAMAGHFAEARDLLEHSTMGRLGRRFTDGEVATALAAAGFHVTDSHGVRIFADLVPGALLDSEPGAADSLVELELATAGLAEFRGFASQLHYIARSPA